MEWKFLFTGEGDKKSELKDIIGEEEYNRLLGEIQESLKEPAPSVSIEIKDENFNPLDTEYVSNSIKECLFPRQNGQSSLLKEQIMEAYGYEDANDKDYSINYQSSGYRNPTWLGLVARKCEIHGIVEKAKYVIYFFSEVNMIPLLKSIDILKETEHDLNRLNGQEFIDKVNEIEKSVRIYLLYEELSEKEVDNED